ncbi:hypothetical protein ACFQI7_14555 [Paenibacillus allorhizosphaerae]|uniref:Uncharacterized protein n=1 Tax=Paenibacillus allorhizosphaerae TaxID=2849866 RepID=A0ABN7TE02_9BACL|nr:hypothetical protein [Paenibacillus allorhizosphaerae]CAG7626830.1 hypothetical protein PAECIP111802_01291 [Paenibacillus allorhizosphaerae]
MRKKWWMIGVGFGICAMLFVASAYSARADAPGYEMYKTALKHTHAAASFTVNADLSVTDNGTKVVGAQAIVKQNRDFETVSVAAALDSQGDTRSMNVYRQDGKAILKSSESDVYKVLEPHHANWKQDGPPKAVEQIIDNVAGRMWEHAQVEAAADGGTQVTLHLSENELPAPIKAAGALMIAKAADNEKWEHVPKLTKNAGVQQIHLDAKIGADGRMEKQTLEIIVSGTDESGKQHVVAIQLLAVISDVDQTVPDRIDLTGKPWEPAKAGEWNHGAQGPGWHY